MAIFSLTYVEQFSVSMLAIPQLQVKPKGDLRRKLKILVVT